VDDLDAVAARLDRRCSTSSLPSMRMLPWLGRKFPAIILTASTCRRRVAHQPDDLARLERERDVVDGLDGAEVLGDIAQF